MYVFDSTKCYDSLSLLNTRDTLDTRQKPLQRLRTFRYYFHKIIKISGEIMALKYFVLCIDKGYKVFGIMRFLQADEHHGRQLHIQRCSVHNCRVLSNNTCSFYLADPVTGCRNRKIHVRTDLRD